WSWCRRAPRVSRALSPEETELWARVTATIRPLSREPLKAEPANEPSAPAVVAPRPRPKDPAPRSQAPPPAPPRPGSTLDGTWDRKLRSGSVQPDRVVDL